MTKRKRRKIPVVQRGMSSDYRDSDGLSSSAIANWHDTGSPDRAKAQAKGSYLDFLLLLFTSRTREIIKKVGGVLSLQVLIVTK
jgi:hypothetical protein